MATQFPISRFEHLQTPFYFYDIDLLQQTLGNIAEHQQKYGFHVHFAVKANFNPRILSEIQRYGLGIDCVSGPEIQRAIDTGFDPRKIVFAGVGKSDEEITLGLRTNICCLNVESRPELEIINEIAGKMGKVADVALRINPNVNAHTHQYITTGLEENKFGIGLWEVEQIAELTRTLPNIRLVGLHFHIGSQITEMEVFQTLCSRINELQKWFETNHYDIRIINVGGGLGIDYEHPDGAPIPDFENYFATFHKFLELRNGQEVHFELGRSVVAQCGTLISRVLYVKDGQKKRFAIIDAGMNDLIRPALYHAYHKIENISVDIESNNQPLTDKFDVVGPVCESSDCFGMEVTLPNVTTRGNFIAIRSAGAYGEVMASRYNLRPLAEAVFSK